MVEFYSKGFKSSPGDEVFEKRLFNRSFKGGELVALGVLAVLAALAVWPAIIVASHHCGQPLLWPATIVAIWPEIRILNFEGMRKRHENKFTFSEMRCLWLDNRNSC